MSDLTVDQKLACIAYVEEEQCLADDVSTDAGDNLLDNDFSAGVDGVWVRGWLFVPKTEIPDYP